jgi:hypothetical protein
MARINSGRRPKASKPGVGFVVGGVVERARTEAEVLVFKDLFFLAARDREAMVPPARCSAPLVRSG